MNCLKCNVNTNPSVDKLINCDGCNRPVHISCSDLTATELKCYELRSSKRRLKYICVDCEQGVHQIPKLIGLINELRSDLEKMKDKLNNLDNQSINHVPSSLSLTATEEIVHEIHERNKRANNFMIYKLTETGTSKENQNEKDTLFVNNLLNRLEVSSSCISVHRMGKFDATKAQRSRPIKIRLESSDSVMNVLKKFKTIKNDELYSNISISPDRTPNQVALYRETKNKLSKRLEEGETNLKIKYQNGIPSIVVSEN